MKHEEDGREPSNGSANYARIEEPLSIYRDRGARNGTVTTERTGRSGRAMEPVLCAFVSPILTLTPGVPESADAGRFFNRELELDRIQPARIR
ncbi:MAG TPA: hypothetical protein VIO16_12625 [Dehalococcoidia bacterium]